MHRWGEVCEFLETLPETRRDPETDGEGVRVRGKVIAFPARNERSRPEGYSADELFVVIRIDLQERAYLVQQWPERFFVTPHYRTYPGVITRLAAVPEEQLEELLLDAWRLVAPKRLVKEWEQSQPR